MQLQCSGPYHVSYFLKLGLLQTEMNIRMASSGMLGLVALVRTDVLEELSVNFMRVTRIGELGTALVRANVVPRSPILVTLMKLALSSSETSVRTRVTRRNIPEDAILHSRRRENLKSYRNENGLRTTESANEITA
jgi:hypothetical protein